MKSASQIGNIPHYTEGYFHAINNSNKYDRNPYDLAANPNRHDGWDDGYKDRFNLRENIFTLPESEETKRGKLIATVLNLKQIKSGPDAGRYNTEWGTKTDLGLFRIVQRIVLDGE